MNDPNTASVAVYKTDRDQLLTIVYAWSAQTGQKYTIKDVVAELVERYGEEIK